MLKTNISRNSVQSLFDSAANAAAKGQAQYLTPIPWATLLATPLGQFRPTMVDLTCGNGQLLTGAKHTGTRQIAATLLGLDIQTPEPMPAALSKHFVEADLCRFYQKLRAVNWTADCFVLNPPFDLHFYREPLAGLADSDLLAVREAFRAHDGRTAENTIDSTIATLCIALDRCSQFGEGFIIANQSTVERLIFAPNAPHASLADHLWAHLIIPGNICQQTKIEKVTGNSRGFRTAVLYFARNQRMGIDRSARIETSQPEEACAFLARRRSFLKNGGEAASYQHTKDTVELWDAAREEQLRETGRLNQPKYNIWLDQTTGEIRTHLNLYDTASGIVDKPQAALLHSLNGRKPIQLLVQRAQRRALENAINPSADRRIGPTARWWRVDPALQTAVAQAMREYDAVRAPLYPLSPIKRLGFLDEQDDILCIKSLGNEYVAGQRYPLQSTTVAVNRQGTKRNNSGTLDAVEYNGQELAFFITNRQGVKRIFMESRLHKADITVNLMDGASPARRSGDRDKPRLNLDFTLEQLTGHFEIPAVPDVASLYPERYAAHMQTMTDLAAKFHPFAFKKFQIEDYCRLALHDGGILGHATGLGKTIAMFIWPVLKAGYRTEQKGLTPKQPVLLIVPGDGHDQTDDESLKHFRTKAVRLDCQSTFLRLSKVDAKTGRRVLPPGYYLTSYTQLAQNQVQDFPPFTTVQQAVADFRITNSDFQQFWDERSRVYRDQYDYLGATTEHTLSQIKALAQQKSDSKIDNGRANQALAILSRITAPSFDRLTADQLAFVREQTARAVQTECAAGIGHSKKGIKCVYSPSLADLCQNAFAVCVIDEGTKIKGDDTLIGQGVRQMAAPYRLVLTATPIKNRFPDVFHLAHYVTGGHEHPTPRFPYGRHDKEDISQEFLVTERNLTREEETNRRYVKYTPQVCNIHRVWKILSCIILRRRKDDCGEDIVPKICHVVNVPMGLSQAAVYQYHLKAKYLDYKGKPAIGAKLQALRIASANPASTLLEAQPGGNESSVPRSPWSYIPKVATGLELACQAMQRGEQVLIGSAFHDGLDAFAVRLQEAGIPHLILDGRMTQKRRGELARLFKLGPPRAVREGLVKLHSRYPIMLAGVESMAELHNFHLCNNVILTAYSWAYDKFEQFINRAHRMTSPWPVNLWSLLCEGSIDPKLNDGALEKKDASDLVLDGRLLGEDQDEVNLADLLDYAFRQFDQIKVVDEDELAKGWPRLRANLCLSYHRWAAGQYTGTSPAPLGKIVSRHRLVPLWKQQFMRRRKP